MALKAKQPQVRLSREGGGQTAIEPIAFPKFPLNEKHYFESLTGLLNHS